jgi:hypothetical protein
MEQLILQMDEDTARRIDEFADSAQLTREEAARRLLALAANVRETMMAKGVPGKGDVREFVVTFSRTPDGVGAVDFRRVE